MKSCRKTSYLLPSFLLLLLFVFGCAEKRPPGPPALFSDPAFLADIRPLQEKGGKTVTLVSPSAGFSEKDIETAYAYADKLNFYYPKGAARPGFIPYNANSDDIRLDMLAAALNDPETRVVWAMRGGYGSSRLLEGLEELGVSPEPKVLIGYSDITFLHLFLQKRGWQTVHGSMFWEFANAGKDEKNFRLLGALLGGRLPRLSYTGLKPFNKPAEDRAERLEGTLTGGNLTCLAAAAGTPWALESSGKILFLEDVNEPGYKVDRMLTQLKQTGAFDGVCAIVLGEFTTGDRNTEYALDRFAQSFDKPVFRTDLFGHGAKNYPLVFNAPAIIERSAKDVFSLSINTEGLGKR